MRKVDEYRKKLEREMKSGLVSLMLLSVISRSSEPVYGYQLIQELRMASKGRLVLREGSVYPILHYLKAQGFVATFLDESPTGAPRKYYTITKLGDEALEVGMASWEELRGTMETVLSEVWG